jgi:cephalosporin-C deacetylase-like acetyl esterase
LTIALLTEYQGLAMPILNSLAAALLAAAFIASIAPAQTPAPKSPPANSATPATAKPAPNPADAGRAQLNQYLDDIAAKQTASRRAAIAAIRTRAEAETRQQLVRRDLLSLLGGLPAKTPLNPHLLGSTQLDGFRIEKVLYDSQPNFPVTALLYVPDAGAHPARLPAIVIAPGHGATGKSTDAAMAATLARNGFAVLSYDPIGQGERLQYPDPAHPGRSLAGGATAEHGEAGLQPTLIGDAVARYFLWDGMRAVDYLLTRPEVDAQRIGAFGCSGGGDMTAILGALDPRIHAIATACYLTSFDTLLPTLGPQDAEQSIPGFLAAGLDFPDWVELAAPRPYAMVGTVSDMFPWAGFLATAKEARRFYSLFDPAVAGTPPQNRDTAATPPTPAGPTLNPDTANTIAPTAPLQVIAGIGGHGNLRPITAEIVSFFLVNLAHSNAQPIVPPPPPSGATPGAPSAGIPAEALQVTPTGQVSTSYPGSETVFSLNLKRAADKIRPPLHPPTLLQLQTSIRMVSKAEAVPGRWKGLWAEAVDQLSQDGRMRQNPTFESDPGIFLQTYLSQLANSKQGRHPAVLVVADSIPNADAPITAAGSQRLNEISGWVDAGNVVLAVQPRPSPSGIEATKSSILGPYYMTELRSEITGKTLLGMRVDDAIHAIDALASRPDVDPNNITAVGSGHMGLVLLHAAVLDPRLKHITIDHTLESYASLLRAPMPLDAPQDILPGVLLEYDIPDLVRALGPRVTFNDPLPGTANLAIEH